MEKINKKLAQLLLCCLFTITLQKLSIIRNLGSQPSGIFNEISS